MDKTKIIVCADYYLELFAFFYRSCSNAGELRRGLRCCSYCTDDETTSEYQIVDKLLHTKTRVYYQLFGKLRSEEIQLVFKISTVHWISDR